MKSTARKLSDIDAQDPEELRHQLIHAYAEFESTFRQRFPWVWISTLLAPLVVTLALLLVMGWIWGFSLPAKFVSAAFLTFFLFGRFIIIGGHDGQASTAIEELTLGSEQLFAMVSYMDFMVALFVTFHMGFLFRMPVVGPKIASFVWDGKYLMEKQPWLKRLAFLGLILFVIFPTSTTGSIGGSIFGRLLGLGRTLTVAGVLIGSLIGNSLMYFFAKEINQYVSEDTIWLKLAGLGLLIGGLFFIEWRYQKMKRKYLEDRETGEPTPSAQPAPIMGPVAPPGAEAQRDAPAIGDKPNRDDTTIRAQGATLNDESGL